MKDLKGKNILFFSPKFFNYENEISKELKKGGANVIWFDERPSNSFLSKVFIRVNKKIILKRIKSYYTSILDNVIDSRVKIDYIFLISPETITKDILHDYQKKLKAKIILYMWDSFKNKGALELLPLIDNVITFDPNDAKKYDLKFRPLFYIEYYKKKEEENVYDFLFIGTAHSDRYLFVKNLVKSIPKSWNVKLYFYLSSKQLFWAKKIFDSDFKSVGINDISYKSLSHEQNAKLLHSSGMILDINHPEQVGLTMRTFETLGAQKKLVTTNRDILNYDFYNKNNIFIVDRKSPYIPLDFLNSKFVPNTTEILNKYSVSGWIKDLFELS